MYYDIPIEEAGTMSKDLPTNSVSYNLELQYCIASFRMVCKRRCVAASRKW